MKVSIIHGPNLNMLGVREPEIYGSSTIEVINSSLKDDVKKYDMNITLDFFQSNSEGDLVSKIQKCFDNCNAIIINPAGYTHTSVAIRDALSLLNIPIIEVHISNTYKREEFRKTMITTPASTAVISGLGAFSYNSALFAINEILNK
jgi:3-dehydroquinate dehydratase-2